MKYFLLILGIVLLLNRNASAQNLYSPLESWSGEYLQANQGALYVRGFLDGFSRGALTQAGSGDIIINLRNLQSGKRYSLKQAAVVNSRDQLQIWKIPTGDYQIEKISMTDSKGLTRNWMPDKAPRIRVRYLFLSNMGEVKIAPSGGHSLKAKFYSKPNLYRSPYAHEAFVGVIDAFSTQVQAKLGGQKILKNAKDQFGSANEARTAFTTTRSISMLYQVESTGAQSIQKSLLGTLNAQDSEMRRCYMDELDISPGLRGSAEFVFQLAGGNGSFSTLKYSGGELKNGRAIECLTFALGKMQFPIRQKVSGRVTFVFDYKEDIGRNRP